MTAADAITYIDDPRIPGHLGTTAAHVHVRGTDACLRRPDGVECLTGAELRAEVERLRASRAWEADAVDYLAERADIAESVVASLDAHLLAFSRWIDAGTTLGPEAQRWHRVAKVCEEAGEAIGALLGYDGANPRKGFTHDLDDLDSELMQTALSALGASAHLHGNDPGYSPFTRLRLQLARDMHRVALDAPSTTKETNR